MVRKIIQRLLRKPVSRLANRFSSRPDKNLIHQSLSDLYSGLFADTNKRGPIIKFGIDDKFIILSDQHKGAKDGSDDFAYAECNYVTALKYYNAEGYTLIVLGDSEELWENTIISVAKHNKISFEAEREFLNREAFIKIFGNHDLYWDNDPLASVALETVYEKSVKIHEAAVLMTEVEGKTLKFFLTHGHQGDKQSDGNWFSKWFISTIWAPLQMYLELNLNTPAEDNHLKNTHNLYMYEWVALQKDTVLITGHTHQPVFMSLTYLERLFNRLIEAQQKNMFRKSGK